MRLVITIALEREIPTEWVRERGISLLSTAALLSGGGNAAGGVVMVLTGLGPDKSRQAACAIRDHLSPCMVVNVGSAGLLQGNAKPGDWVSPHSVQPEGGAVIAIDAPRPFPTHEAIRTGGRLVTVAQPVLGDRSVEGDYVDMEGGAQGEVFCPAGISFHIIKWISDRAGTNAKKEWRETIGEMRHALKKLLAFCERNLPSTHISVVIPVHNRQERIDACVESVLRQTTPPHEIIVVNDGSDDGTAAALIRFGERIRVVTLSGNKGVSAARNRGVAEASGEWIAFLDSDDCWTPEKLEKQVAFLHQHPFYRIMQSEEIWIRNGVRVNRKKHHRKPEGFIFTPSLKRCLVSPSTTLMEKNLLDEMGGFDENLPACEDYDLWLKITRHHPVGLDPTPSTIKQGGHDDQLSRRYAAIDQFRVTALRNALERENAQKERAAIIATLREKLTILRDGCHKRARNDEALRYASMLAETE